MYKGSGIYIIKNNPPCNSTEVFGAADGDAEFGGGCVGSIGETPCVGRGGGAIEGGGG